MENSTFLGRLATKQENDLVNARPIQINLELPNSIETKQMFTVDALVSEKVGVAKLNLKFTQLCVHLV